MLYVLYSVPNAVKVLKGGCFRIICGLKHDINIYIREFRKLEISAVLSLS